MKIVHMKYQTKESSSTRYTLNSLTDVVIYLILC